DHVAILGQGGAVRENSTGLDVFQEGRALADLAGMAGAFTVNDLLEQRAVLVDHRLHVLALGQCRRVRKQHAGFAIAQEFRFHQLYLSSSLISPRAKHFSAVFDEQLTTEIPISSRSSARMPIYARQRFMSICVGFVSPAATLCSPKKCSFSAFGFISYPSSSIRLAPIWCARPMAWYPLFLPP